MEGMQVSINYLAVIVVTILSFLIGFIWYGPLFGKPWMEANNITKENVASRKMSLIFGTSIVLTLIIALNLAAFLGPKADFSFGLFAGAATGIGFISAAIGVTYAFSGKSLKLFFIDAGYWTVVLILMGAILGVWK